MLHKAIKGFEDYLISDDGRVYSLKSQKYLKPKKVGAGYYQVVLCKNGKSKQLKVHRLVAEAFISNPDNKPEVDHINRIKTDNRVENLRWATRSENNKNRDHYQINRMGKGLKINEIVGSKEISYPSLNTVPDIHHQTLRNHIVKGETDFYVKQHNGKVRHFIVPQQKG